MAHAKNSVNFKHEDGALPQTLCLAKVSPFLRQHTDPAHITHPDVPNSQRHQPQHRSAWFTAEAGACSTDGKAGELEDTPSLAGWGASLHGESAVCQPAWRCVPPPPSVPGSLCSWASAVLTFYTKLLWPASPAAILHPTCGSDVS